MSEFTEQQDALIAALAPERDVILAIESYLVARRLNAGDTALLPSIGPDQTNIIRGKAQAFFELLEICKLARELPRKGEDHG